MLLPSLLLLFGTTTLFVGTRMQHFGVLAPLLFSRHSVMMPTLTAETSWGLFTVDPDVATVLVVVALH
jgi:hypothetical protein